MSIKKRLPALLCSLALTASLAAPALAYTDVAEGAWYREDIQAVTDQGLMTGVTADRFDPEGTVTRATVITVLWRLEGSPDVTVASLFSDIPERSWAYTAAAWAKAVGVAAGYSDGTFGPGDSVTREQLAVFLYRYAVYKGQPVAQGVVDLYDDASYIHSWALTGMKHALGAGLMTGNGKSLSPLGLASRAQLAAVLVNLLSPAQG